MRSALAIAALAPLLGCVTAVPVEKNALHARQSGLDVFGSVVGNAISSAIGVKAPLSTKTLTPKYNPKATREVKTWGPYHLQPSNGTHAPGLVKLDPDSDFVMSLVTGICNDCTVLFGDAEMVYKDGTVTGIANGVYGHHFITADLGRPQVMPPAFAFACNNTDKGKSSGNTGGMSGMSGMSGMKKSKRQQLPQLPGGMGGASVFVAKGGDAGTSVFTAVNSTVNSGFYIGKQDQILFTAELVNYDPVPKEVYFQLDYEYLPGRTPGLLDVGMGTLDVGGCFTNYALSPPADGPITYTSPPWNVIANGYLVNITPHLHDGAVDIKVYLNGKLVCTAHPIYGGAAGGTTIDGQSWETISGYESCTEPVPLKVGDVLTMTSDYDLTKHRLRPFSENHEMGAEAMAMANFQFAKAN